MPTLDFYRALYLDVHKSEVGRFDFLWKTRHVDRSLRAIVLFNVKQQHVDALREVHGVHLAPHLIVISDAPVPIVTADDFYLPACEALRDRLWLAAIL